MNRRAFLYGLSALGVGCGAPAGGASLTIAVNAGVEGDALKTAAREWGALRGAGVDTVEFPYANLFEKELLDLTSRTGAYDIVMMDDPWFPRLVEGGNLTPLESLFRARGLDGPDEDFIGSCLAVCRHPYATGGYYALPYVGNSQLFFYRRDLFDEHGLSVPGTWDEVLAAARIIGKAENMYGYVMRAGPGNAVVTDFMPLFWAFGAQLFDEGGRPALDSRNSEASLRFMLELGRYSPPGYAGFNADEVSAHLLQSTAVMSINWPAWIQAMDDPARSKVAGRIGFAPMPSQKDKGVPSLGSWLLGIPEASNKAELAFDFLLWATEKQQMKQAALRGNPPTRESVFLDEDLRGRFRAFPEQLASLRSARPRPRTPYWNEIEHAFGIFLSKANAGSLAAGEAMQMAQETVAEILESHR